MDVKNVSYAGRPLDNTAMYITKKVERLVKNLSEVSGCKVFVESGVIVPDDIASRNEFVYTDTPQKDYAVFVNRLAKEREEYNRSRKYMLTDEGYYIGENVQIGVNAVIEPGAFIDHDVVIGNNAVIKSGAKLRNLIAGDNFVACENCTVGTNGFTMADDDEGNKMRIPTLGKVQIGNNVEINSLANVSCGSAGNTVFEDNVKIDSLVHIGHDVHLGKNVEIPAGAIIGGFCEIKEGAFIGINATLRNRINIGEKAFVGMGAVVTKSISEGITVVGNPARPLVKKEK